MTEKDVFKDWGNIYYLNPEEKKQFREACLLHDKAREEHPFLHEYVPLANKSMSCSCGFRYHLV